MGHNYDCWPENAGSAVKERGDASGLKAWCVRSATDEYTTLVFAPTRNKARSLARSLEAFCDADWVDLRAKREPEADKYVAQFCAYPSEGFAIECRTTAECRVMRELGYFEVDADSAPCDECGLHQWSLVPESCIYEYHKGAFCKQCAPVPAGTQFIGNVQYIGKVGL
jgi:hypothetical protein